METDDDNDGTLFTGGRLKFPVSVPYWRNTSMGLGPSITYKSMIPDSEDQWVDTCGESESRPEMKPVMDDTTLRSGSFCGRSNGHSVTTLLFIFKCYGLNWCVVLIAWLPTHTLTLCHIWCIYILVLHVSFLTLTSTQVSAALCQKMEAVCLGVWEIMTGTEPYSAMGLSSSYSNTSRLYRR